MNSRKMKNFFVPQAWSDKFEVLAFKPLRNIWNAAANGIKGNVETMASSLPSKGRKKNKLRKKVTETGEDEPSSSMRKFNIEKIETEETASIKKVRSGRVEKKQSKKQLKQKLTRKPKLAKAATEAINQTSQTSIPSVVNSIKNKSKFGLKERLKETLLGGRFRFLNEQLYTIDSQSAEQLFREDNDAFNAYHDGYRHQVERWPLNPLNRIIQMIRSLPKSLEIADFGCGEGKLAKSVPNKVYSLDLVSMRSDIIACDMANTPLQPQSIDVAVYCLSLMGTNLKDYLIEANRVLRIGGLVYIAEIQSRFEDERSFIRGLEACGFELIKKDSSKKLFYFFQFKKVRNVGKVVILPAFTLKPCLYRRR